MNRGRCCSVADRLRGVYAALCVAQGASRPGVHPYLSARFYGDLPAAHGLTFAQNCTGAGVKHTGIPGGVHAYGPPLAPLHNGPGDVSRGIAQGQEGDVQVLKVTAQGVGVS